jgi:2-oxoisovalerate ferredoxin oxidoreductase beta subunit
MKNQISKPESLYDQFERKPGVEKKSTHYCPGCGHGNVHKFIAETLDELGVRERTIFVSPVGCSVFGYYYFRCGNIQAAHGRAPAVATAVKRAHPEAIVICYQGDGDLASIGGNEILQAANRGENFTVIFVNNALYGMTGGQMAPTTLIGQRTTTSPQGRSAENEGYPLRVSELLAQLEAPVYIERCHLDESSHVLKTRAAIRKAIQAQIDGKGFALVEVVSPCPTGWGMEPLASREWITQEMAKVFPAHVACDRRKDRPAKPNPRFVADEARIREVLGLAGENLRPEPTSDHHTYRMLMAGFGGQGVLSLGMLIARTGMLQGRRVSWLPSYGPEMRGGTANCSVVLSDRRIGSPLISTPDVLIAFNEPSLEKFGPLVVPGGTVLYDDSFVTKPWDRADVRVVRVPFSSMANELGTSKVTNMVAFGAINRLLGLFPSELVHRQIQGLGKRSLAETNLSAFEAGTAAVRAGLKESVL